MYAEAAGIQRITPAAVAVAVDVEDVLLALRWARDNHLPVTPRGSGSSMAGGAVGAGLVLDLTRLAYIDEVDRDAVEIRCGPGALRDDVDAAARRAALRFPVDPSSGRFCTMGGMVATNAAGAHSLGFGATSAWVDAIECVFADGTRATLRRGVPAPDLPTFARVLKVLERCQRNAAAFHRDARKDSSGYGIGRWLGSDDLLDVVVGSEGTLAIVTGVELRLAPLPAATTSLLAAFPDLDTAADAAQVAREAGAKVCELLDATFLQLVEAEGRLPPLPQGTAAVLLTGLESSSAADAAEQAAGLEHVFRGAGAHAATVALLPDAEREVWELRHAASPLLATMDAKLRSVQVIEDAAVPPPALATYVRALRDALGRRNTRGVIFGHAGDAHVHVNPLVDVARPGWKEELDSLLDEVTGVVAELGGTLTGEHGDGRLRAPLLERTWPAEAVRAFAELKAAFDPDGILNPGVKLPVPGQRPLEDVKYDPELPPLPSAARAALDEIGTRRAYAVPRLSLLDRGS